MVNNKWPAETRNSTLINVYPVMKKEGRGKIIKTNKRGGYDKAPVDGTWEDRLSGARMGHSFPRWVLGLEGPNRRGLREPGQFS